MAVCRHIDTFVEDGQIDETQGQMVLNIIRIKNPKFAKAISAFVSMVQRMSIREQADLAKTASIVLNFMTRSRFVDDHGNPNISQRSDTLPFTHTIVVFQIHVSSSSTKTSVTIRCRYNYSPNRLRVISPSSY